MPLKLTQAPSRLNTGDYYWPAGFWFVSTSHIYLDRHDRLNFFATAEKESRLMQIPDGNYRYTCFLVSVFKTRDSLRSKRWSREKPYSDDKVTVFSSNYWVTGSEITIAKSPSEHKNAHKNCEKILKTAFIVCVFLFYVIINGVLIQKNDLTNK